MCVGITNNGNSGEQILESDKKMELVKSTSYDQTKIINNILKLHVPSGKIECDPTYSIGNFYKNTGIDIPKYRYDINPQIDGVLYADAANLPLDARGSIE